MKWLLSANSPRLTQHAREVYKINDKEVNVRSSSRYKRAFVEKQACEAEKAAANGDLSTVYKVTKQLTEQNNTCTKPVKEKEWKVITTERKQAAR